MRTGMGGSHPSELPETTESRGAGPYPKPRHSDDGPTERRGAKRFANWLDGLGFRLGDPDKDKTLDES